MTEPTPKDKGRKDSSTTGLAAMRYRDFQLLFI